MKKTAPLLILFAIATISLCNSCSSKDHNGPQLEVTTLIYPRDSAGTFHLALQINKTDNNIQKAVLLLDNSAVVDTHGSRWDGQNTSGSSGYYGSEEAVTDTVDVKFTQIGTYNIVVTAYDTDGNATSQTTTLSKIK